MKQKQFNSYENVKNNNPDDIIDEAIENENKLKTVKYYIDNKKINFTYFYKFPKAEKYIIKYKFKNLLKVVNYMFSCCKSLISLDLSNFNIQNITNMSSMSDWESLISLNLSNFNTQNITDISYIFSGCES